MRAWLLSLALVVAAPATAADRTPEADPDDVADDAADEGGGVKVSPFAVFVGGLAGEVIDRRDDGVDQREGRVWTPAVARIGLAGKLHPRVTIASEVEFNGGPYGTSVWEGQAAIQIRNQLVRYQADDLLGEGDRLQLEVGRVTDPASVNFVSLHIANLLLSDPLARFPLLTSGFNRGNGARVAYTLKDALTFGFTFNAGNPTSTTATVMVGGTFPPFQRFYEVPWSVVGRDARGFPASNFHMMMASPSARLTTKHVTAQLAAQTFRINTNTNTESDENLTGTNLRGGVRVSALDDHLVVFGNGSRVINDVVELDDLATLADAKFLGITVGGGMDVNVKDLNGFGVQYDRVREEQRGNEPEIRHFLNAGGTVFLTDTVFLSGRFAFFQRCQDGGELERCDVDGRRQAMLTLTAVLGPSPDVMP